MLENTELLRVTWTEARAYLASSEIKLWRALVWARDRADERCGPWFLAELGDLSAAILISKYTAVEALAGLRSCGLVATARSYVLAETTSGIVAPRADRNWYHLQGELEGADMKFPRASWSALVARCSPARTWAEKTHLRRLLPALKRPPEPPRVSTRNSIPTSSVSLSETKGYEIPKVGREHFAPPSRSEAFFGGSAFKAGGRETKLDRDLRALSRAPRPELPKSTYEYVPRELSPRDDLPAFVGYVPADALPQHKAKYVVDGWRAAVKELYGKDPYTLNSVDWDEARDLDKPGARPAALGAREAKLLATYRKMLACGLAMSDHAVPPKHWALWRLKWLREKNPKFKNKAPPIFMVMVASAVAKRAGWFRKEYDVKRFWPQQKPDLVRQEQMFRNSEAAALAAGRVTPRLARAPFPQWYFDKREREITIGITDPMECYPVKRRRLA